MNEIITQRIEKAAKRYAWANDTKALPYDTNTRIPIGVEVERAAIYGAAFVLQNQWISVEEALPPCPDDDAISEVSIGVIVRTSEGLIRYAYYHHYLQQWFSVETSTRLAEVTHWMFVPEEGGEK